MRGNPVENATWSPCSRFIAAGDFDRKALIPDATTLERLYTFVPIRRARWLSFSPDSRSLTGIEGRGDNFITWDLQTGGKTHATSSIRNGFSSHTYISSTHSMDGKTLAVVLKDSDDATATTISTYNLPSGTHIYSHRVSEGRIVAKIWAHGELLQFVVVKPGSVTVWGVGFTSIHTLAEIESLPAPDEIGHSRESLFLPTHPRLAFIIQDTVQVWDARDSKFILNFAGDDRPKGLSFSSDGCFFACGSTGREIHLWKESSTGYALHRKLLSNIGQLTDYGVRPLLSPDGESIVTFSDSEIQLWRTTDPINPPSSVPTQPAEQTHFILAFSPDKSFLATGWLGKNIATIVDLKSGDPRLIVDAGMKICGLGVTRSTVIIVGEGKVITWNLPAEDCVLDATADIHDSVRTMVFDHPPPPPETLHSASISPDFNHFVIARRGGEGLDIYDMSTGRHLVSTTVQGVFQPWFTSDGREVRYSNSRGVSGGKKIIRGEGSDIVFQPWYTSDRREVRCSNSRGVSGGEKIIRGEGSDIIGLEPIEQGPPSGGYLWKSSHGHDVTHDGWILDSRKKRLMWLPHHLRVSEEDQIWSGRFLALFDRRLPEPVIIEMVE